MQKVSGKEISGEIIESLKKQPAPDKILGAVLVGENPTSKSFLKQKQRTAAELGVDFRTYELSADISSDNLRREIGKLVKNKKVGGLFVQLPLPEGINKHYILNAIPREKDVDVLGERALGAFYNKRNPISPPAVETVAEILKRQDVNLGNLRVAVVGLGDLVGKPLSVWLSGKSKELILLDIGSSLDALREADLVISGVGRAGLIQGKSLKEGAGVIDFGYSFVGEKIRGDLDVETVSKKLAFYTPTPGGTGPILVSKLVENFYKLNQRP